LLVLLLVLALPCEGFWELCAGAGVGVDLGCHNISADSGNCMLVLFMVLTFVATTYRLLAFVAQ
jgi:hypothetical protein